MFLLKMRILSSLNIYLNTWMHMLETHNCNIYIGADERLLQEGIKNQMNIFTNN